jgi:hypothetical protein
MTNDSKLGMAAGVAGVIVAAVLLSNGPPQAAQSKPGDGPPKEKLTGQPQLQAGTPPAAVAPEPAAGSPALPSTPAARTRKDVDAQPASLSGGAEEP